MKLGFEQVFTRPSSLCHQGMRTTNSFCRSSSGIELISVFLCFTISSKRTPTTGSENETKRRGAGMKRRRRLTGSGAHRLSSPEKLQLDVTISSQSHGKEASSGDDGGIPTERSNNKNNINTNNPTQRRANGPFCLKNIFYSLFISQAPAAHWSLHTDMSHSLASLRRLMKLPWVLLTDTIRFKKPQKARGKTPVTYPTPCARVPSGVGDCHRVDGWRRISSIFSWYMYWPWDDKREF